MRFAYISLVLIGILVLAGCSNTNKSEINTCINDEDSKAEKDCFMELVCKNQDFNLCENLPEDTNARQGNKGFCLAFVTSMTHDLRICRNQENQYYADVCEMGYQRWGMAYDPSGIEEFEELRTKYGCVYEKKESEEPKAKENWCPRNWYYREPCKCEEERCSDCSDDEQYLSIFDQVMNLNEFSKQDIIWMKENCQVTYPQEKGYWAG
ncbi:hypothetical protein HYU10_05460 [Candidatus Woesearchaeota archaeon]|nr:hypothetical protein [Candidatus Woesearchaeota archaeon]